MTLLRSIMLQEVRQLKDKIRALTEELEKTKADNVKLYGKIRYVQDYNHEKVVSRGSKRVGCLIVLLKLLWCPSVASIVISLRFYSSES